MLIFKILHAFSHTAMPLLLIILFQAEQDSCHSWAELYSLPSSWLLLLLFRRHILYCCLSLRLLMDDEREAFCLHVEVIFILLLYCPPPPPPSLSKGQRKESKAKKCLALPSLLVFHDIIFIFIYFQIVIFHVIDYYRWYIERCHGLLYYYYYISHWLAWLSCLPFRLGCFLWAEYLSLAYWLLCFGG